MQRVLGSFIANCAANDVAIALEINAYLGRVKDEMREAVVELS